MECGRFCPRGHGCLETRFNRVAEILPNSKSLLNLPKSAGAMAMPRGFWRGPLAMLLGPDGSAGSDGVRLESPTY